MGNTITDSEFVVTVPMGRGTKQAMGQSAVFDTGGVEAALTGID